MDITIREAEQHGTSGGLSISARASGFLVIGFERTRHVVVDDEAKFGLVDSHPERIRGDDHIDLAAHEAVLHLSPLFGNKSRVVQADLAFRFLLEELNDLFALLPRGSVHDPASWRLRKDGQQSAVLVTPPRRLEDFKS